MTSFIYQLIKILPAPVLISLFAMRVSAASPTADDDPTGILQAAEENQDFTPGDLVDIIFDIAQWILAIAGIVAVIMALVSAYQLLTAGGKEEQYNRAKKTLTYALVGTAIAIVSFAIVSFVDDIFTQSGGGL